MKSDTITIPARMTKVVKKKKVALLFGWGDTQFQVAKLKSSIAGLHRTFPLSKGSSRPLM